MKFEEIINRKINKYFIISKSNTNLWFFELKFDFKNGFFIKPFLFNQYLEHYSWITHYIDYTNKKWDELVNFLNENQNYIIEINKRDYIKLEKKFIKNYKIIVKMIRSLVI